MDEQKQDAAAAEPKPEMTPEERTSKVGDLGRGSHEQTQGGSGAPTELPGDEKGGDG